MNWLSEELAREADRLYARMQVVRPNVDEFHIVNIAALDVALLEYQLTHQQELKVMWVPEGWTL